MFEDFMLNKAQKTPVYSIHHMSVYVMHPDQFLVVAATQAIQDVMDGE